ncbi:MAG: 3'-5' exonuclease [Desulfotomaculales bacterium]
MKWFGRPRDQVVADAGTVSELRAHLQQGRVRLPAGVLLRELRFVVLDTETTGFHPQRGDEVIAVGAVVVEGGDILSDLVFHRLVNPHRPIPPVITALTGITQEMVAGAEDIGCVLKDFFRFARDAVLVGHSIGFDLAFLNKKLNALCGLRVQHPLLDTRVIARVLYPHLASRTLDVLLAYHGIKPEGRHTALGDALLTARLFVRFLDLLARQHVVTLGELYRYIGWRLQHHARHATFF